MNCIEVGELMQRNLDLDLDEQELTILMNHMSGCTSCSQLFEKLTLLSGSLEQLPRVTPSISIVDAILPELERIDQLKLKEQSVSRNKRSRMRWYTGFGSVAAAAIVIITMVSLNGLPSSNNDNASIAFDGFAERSMQKNSVDAQLNDVTADAESMPSVTSMSDEGNADSKLPTVAFDEDPAQSYDGVISQFGTQKEFSYESEGTSKIALEDQSGDGKMDRDTANVSDPGQSTVSSFSSSAGGMQTSTNGMNDTEEQELGLMGNQNNPDSVEVETPQNFSPDEQVYLVFEEHTISVYESSTGELVQQWPKLADVEYQFGEWATDQTYFTYTVVDSDGNLQSYSERLYAEE